MIFSSQFAPGVLVAWCRTLHHGSDIGLSPVKMFRQLAKSGPAAGRAVAERIADRLKAGDSLSDACQAESSPFPRLFLELLAVGEESGRLTTTFAELEQYFESVVATRKQFLQALIYPGFVYVSGIVVIALMLLVLGMMAPAGSKPFDPLGLGLTGPTGAMLFLTAAGLFTGAVILLFVWIRESDSLRPILEGLGMKLPGVGSCLKAFALHRFCLAWQMAAEAGMLADRALSAAFQAAANDAYLAHRDEATARVREGIPPTKVLARCGEALFPGELQDAVSVGEVTGKLPEVLAKQSEQYREEALRKMKFLTMVAGGSIYALVGLMIIIAIIRMVMSVGGVYQDAMKGI